MSDAPSPIHTTINGVSYTLSDVAEAIIADLTEERNDALLEEAGLRSQIEALTKERDATAAERDRAMHACEQIAERMHTAEAIVADCGPYLKEGEVPLERIERDHLDTLALMATLEKVSRDRDALRALLREAGEALRPFAREEGTWALSVKDRYRPGVTEPNYKQAHARAEFSIGDLRRARAVLTKLEAMG